MSSYHHLTQRVFEYTTEMELERDPWEKGPALTAMLRSGSDEMIAFAKRSLKRSVRTQTTAGHLNYDDVRHGTYGHVRTFTPTMKGASLGYPLLQLYEMEPVGEYLAAAQRQADMALNAPRTADGGVSARAENVELWIDFVYLLVPFLIKLGKITGDEKLVDEGYSQLRVHVDHLVDPLTGLARHAWIEKPNSFGQSTFWSRGNGWLGAGIVEVLSMAPNHDNSKVATEVLTRMVGSIATLQDASGYWREVMDDPRSPLESSGTLIHAYTMARAVEMGILGQEYLDPAVRAFSVVAGAVTPNGAVRGVSLPPGGPGVPLGVASFGQGFFIQAAQVLARLGAIDMYASDVED